MIRVTEGELTETASTDEATLAYRVEGLFRAYHRQASAMVDPLHIPVQNMLDFLEHFHWVQQGRYRRGIDRQTRRGRVPATTRLVRAKQWMIRYRAGRRR